MSIFFLVSMRMFNLDSAIGLYPVSKRTKRSRTDLSDEDQEDSKDTTPRNCSMQYMRGVVHITCLQLMETEILPKVIFLDKAVQDQNEIKADADAIYRYAQFLFMKGLAQDWKSFQVLPQTKDVFILWHHHMKNYSLDYCSLLATLQRSSVFQTEKELESYIHSVPEFAPANSILHNVVFPSEE